MSAGLPLLKPNGFRWWRFDYRYGGKRKTLSMGVYPDVGLKEARNRRDDARKLLASDVDPGENRKAVKFAKFEKAAKQFRSHHAGVVYQVFRNLECESWRTHHAPI